MRATELMIGDWVRVPVLNEKNCKVSSIASSHVALETDCSYVPMIYNVEPIPLTAEILEKNRFERRANRMFFYIDDFYIQGHRNGEWSMVGMIYQKIKFRYVHELQHALRLCGIDKEIIMPNTQES